MSRYAVIDFETTGLSPDHGASPTEVGIVLVEGGKIVDRYQSLMNPGASIPPFIQQLTGITDAMVRSAASISTVMKQAADFVGETPLLAHNASFDKKFWQVELIKIQRKPRIDFVCSLLLARRLYPECPDHKLATLVRMLKLEKKGNFHRALADAECTAHLFLRICKDLEAKFQAKSVDHNLLLAIQSASKNQLQNCIDNHRGRN